MDGSYESHVCWFCSALPPWTLPHSLNEHTLLSMVQPRGVLFLLLTVNTKNVFSHPMRGKRRRSIFQNNTPLPSPALDVAQIIRPYRQLSLSDTRPDLSAMLWYPTLPAESFSLRSLNTASVLGGGSREAEWWTVSKISPGAPNGNQSNNCFLRYCPGML